MFRLLENTLLWKQQFDSSFRVFQVPFQKFDRRRIEELRLYWREKGRYCNFSPGEAVFRAFEEFANEYYNKHCEYKSDMIKGCAERDFQDIACNLNFAAYFRDKVGNYNLLESPLSPLWRSFLEEYHEREKREDAERKARCEEVVSHKFTREEIDAEWQRLIAGDIHTNAKIIWKNLSPRKTVHEISKKTKLSLRDVLYWIIIFREHYIVNEETHLQENLYSQNVERLGAHVKTLVERLNG